MKVYLINKNAFAFVNIFICCLFSYLLFQNETFYVPAGSLSFSVVIYTLCGVTCICFLLLRRYLRAFGPGELGGTKGLKFFTAIFFIFLWILYVLLSAFQAYYYIPGF